MLQSSSYNAALPFAQQLAEKGKVVTAKQGTVLGELVRLSAPAAEFTTKENAATMYGDYICAVSEGALDKPSAHDLEMDAYINQISKLVLQHINYAKNTVKPLVMAFSEAMQNYLQNNKTKEASQEYNIEILRLPAVLKDESFLDTLSSYKDKSILTPDVAFKFTGKTESDLAAMILTGHDRTDKLIVEWMSHRPDGFLEQVWTSFFTSLESSNVSTYSYEDLLRLNAFDKADYALAINLLARKVLNDVQESDMNLTFYKKIANQYLEYSGALIVDAIKKIDLMIRTKVMIVSAIGNVSKVNAEVYGPWLEAGGCPEIILGHLISDNQPSSLTLIDQKADEYKKGWYSYESFYKSREANRSFDYLKGFIQNKFVELLKQMEAIETDYIQKNPAYIEESIKKLDLYLSTITSKDILDVNTVSLKVMASCRFFFTSSYQILSDIEEATKANPNVDVREAALLAVINYVADYVANQLVLTDGQVSA